MCDVTMKQQYIHRWLEHWQQICQSENFSHFSYHPPSNVNTYLQGETSNNMSSVMRKPFICICKKNKDADHAQGYKTFFMLNSAEIKIYPAHKC